MATAHELLAYLTPTAQQMEQSDNESIDGADSDVEIIEAPQQQADAEPEPVRGQLTCVVCQGGIFRGQATVKCGVCTDTVVHLSCCSEIWINTMDPKTSTCPVCRSSMGIRLDNPTVQFDTPVMVDPIPAQPAANNQPAVNNEQMPPIFFEDRESLDLFAMDLKRIVCNHMRCTAFRSMPYQQLFMTLSPLITSKKYGMGRALATPELVRSAIFEAAIYHPSVTSIAVEHQDISAPIYPAYTCTCPLHD